MLNNDFLNELDELELKAGGILSAPSDIIKKTSNLENVSQNNTHSKTKTKLFNILKKQQSENS
ncbi:MAG: hypothetical protein HWQ36_26165 [Nostoc sp. NMS2]|uniref:hypothetical protein n=1 Tax=Nostoc sp. NMS2 TaxID=2815389 RepID=UPI0025E62EA3|nr:hypothetical protein [Nostoc sp. NMS2]MBN3993873.1 hypothetical protein [Nostoc sp. NMS2]